jgi:hypothetical protein
MNGLHVVGFPFFKKEKGEDGKAAQHLHYSTLFQNLVWLVFQMYINLKEIRNKQKLKATTKNYA